MPDPLTISEAFTLLMHQHNQQSSSDHKMPSAVDIIGIVVGVSLYQSPSTSLQKCSILITDPSVDTSGANVRVILFGSTELSKVVQEQVSNGDILRFNRLSLNHQNSSKGGQIMEFSYPHDRRGADWFRLATSGSNNEQQQQRIPNDFVTSKDLLNKLNQWSVLESLKPLPCQRRSLREIQGCAGLLSNVVVHVSQYECRHMITPQKTGAKRGRKSTSISIGFATLRYTATASNGNQTTIMSMVDTSNRFESALDEVKGTNQQVMLTNVYSINLCDVDKQLFRSSWRDDVVLMPTKSTNVFILDEEENEMGEGIVGKCKSSQELFQTQKPPGTQTQNEHPSQNNPKYNNQSQYSECSWWLTQHQREQQVKLKSGNGSNSFNSNSAAMAIINDDEMVCNYNSIQAEESEEEKKDSYEDGKYAVQESTPLQGPCPSSQTPRSQKQRIQQQVICEYDDDEKEFEFNINSSIRDITIDGISLLEILNKMERNKGRTTPVKFLKIVRSSELSGQYTDSAKVFLNASTMTAAPSSTTSSSSSSSVGGAAILLTPTQLQNLLGGVDASELLLYAEYSTKLIHSMIREEVQLQWTIGVTQNTITNYYQATVKNVLLRSDINLI